MIDFNDEQQIQKFAIETVELAKQYKDSRIEFGNAKFKLDKKLAEGYELEKIKQTMSYEKALIMLSVDDVETKISYESYIKSEQNYKGIEAVLKAREAVISLHQSLIKNKINEKV